MTNETKIGSVIECARRMEGVELKRLSLNTRIAFSRLESIEKGISEPTIFEWREIARVLKIPMDSIKKGFIDRQTIATLRSSQIENGYSLPLDYIDYRCFKVRELLPYLLFIERNDLNQRFDSWLKNIGLERSFFSSLDNQLNLAFYSDLIDFLIREFNLTFDQVEQIAAFTADASSHGQIFDRYLAQTEPIARLKEYISSQVYYQSMFYYKIEDVKSDYMKVSMRAEGLIFENAIASFDSTALSFLELMREANFKAIANVSGSMSTKKLQVRELESMYENFEMSLFEFQTA